MKYFNRYIFPLFVGRELANFAAYLIESQQTYPIYVDNLSIVSHSDISTHDYYHSFAMFVVGNET